MAVTPLLWTRSSWQSLPLLGLAQGRGVCLGDPPPYEVLGPPAFRGDTQCLGSPTSTGWAQQLGLCRERGDGVPRLPGFAVLPRPHDRAREPAPPYSPSLSELGVFPTGTFGGSTIRSLYLATGKKKDSRGSKCPRISTVAPGSCPRWLGALPRAL